MKREETIEVVDLGDAMVETRQGSPAGSYFDSIHFLGSWPG
ncbi:MAG: hypothetical protein ABW171_15540 [Steroidobacter sp.]